MHSTVEYEVYRLTKFIVFLDKEIGTEYNYSKDNHNDILWNVTVYNLTEKEKIKIKDYLKNNR